MAKDKDADGVEGDEGKKGPLGGKLKLVAIILPVLLVIGGGAYFFLLRGGEETGKETSTSAHASECEEGDEECEAAAEEEGGEEGEGEGEEEATPTSTYKPGEVVTVDPVTVNLAGGHYLKVGLAMQATADAGEEVAAGKAADAIITEFSGRTIEELSSEEGREESKKELLKAVKKIYEKKVYEIYYTTYVMN